MKNKDQKRKGYQEAITNLQIIIANLDPWKINLINEYTLELQRYKKLLKEND